MEEESVPIFMLKPPVIPLRGRNRGIMKVKNGILALWYSLGTEPILTGPITFLFHPYSWGLNLCFLVPIRFGCRGGMIHSELETLRSKLKSLL